MTTKSPAKGVTKKAPKTGPKGASKGASKGGPKHFAKGIGKPAKSGQHKRTPGPSSKTNTPEPEPESIPSPNTTTIPITVDPNAPFFCCTTTLPPASSFPPALTPFYTFLLYNREPATNNPYPISMVPPSATYFRFSHLSLATLEETHRYFLSQDPQGEGCDFVEGTEEEVLEKAGALTGEERKQDVMILSRNARCVNHAPVGREGFWFVLMRVDGLQE